MNQGWNQLISWLCIACLIVFYLIGRNMALAVADRMRQASYERAQKIHRSYVARWRIAALAYLGVDLIVRLTIRADFAPLLNNLYEVSWMCTLALLLGFLQKKRMDEALDRAKRFDAFRRDDEQQT